MERRGEQAAIVLEGQAVPYRLQRSRRRRTVSLSVDPDRGLVVYSPQRLARRRVEAILQGKARWILARTAEAERLRARRTVAWAPGALLPLRGAFYPLAVRHAGRARRLRLEAGRLLLSLPARAPEPAPGERLREQVVAGYKSLAREELARRVAHFEARLGVRAGTLRVKAHRRRWGSCSARGGLNFNWRLILAPPAVLDYVVVHELCHLLHLDHSPRFWARVAALLPEYRAQQAWLREHGAALYI